MLDTTGRVLKGPGKFGIVKTQKEAAILILLLSGHPKLLP